MSVLVPLELRDVVLPFALFFDLFYKLIPLLQFCKVCLFAFPYFFLIPEVQRMPWLLVQERKWTAFASHLTARC